MLREEDAPDTDVSRQARARAFLSRAGLVDGHNDLPSRILELWDGDVAAADLTRLQPELHTDLARIRAGGLTAQFMAAFVPGGLSPEDAQARAVRLLEIIHALGQAYPQLAIVDTIQGLEVAQRYGQVSVIPAIENADALAGEIDAVDLFRRLGVRYITLTHNGSNEWADSAFGDRVHGGLSDHGVRLIERMNDVGVLVDCSHTTDEATLHACEVSRTPVILSHTNARTLSPSPRNASDEVIRRGAGTGGVIGVNFFPPLLVAGEGYSAARAEGASTRATGCDVANHVNYLRDIAGIDHVAIGSDFDGIGITPHGLEDVGSFPSLFIELADRGYSRSDLEKIASKNLLRVLATAEEGQS